MTPKFSCLSCILLLASLPVNLHGFTMNFGGFTDNHRVRGSIIYGERLLRVRESAIPLVRRGGEASLVCMNLGPRDGGSNEHKDYKDQREGTDNSSSEKDDELVSE